MLDLVVSTRARTNTIENFKWKLIGKELQKGGALKRKFLMALVFHCPSLTRCLPKVSDSSSIETAHLNLMVVELFTYIT